MAIKTLLITLFLIFCTQALSLNINRINVEKYDALTEKLEEVMTDIRTTAAKTTEYIKESNSSFAVEYRKQSNAAKYEVMNIFYMSVKDLIKLEAIANKHNVPVKCADGTETKLTELLEKSTALKTDADKFRNSFLVDVIEKTHNMILSYQQYGEYIAGEIEQCTDEKCKTRLFNTAVMISKKGALIVAEIKSIIHSFIATEVPAFEKYIDINVLTYTQAVNDVIQKTIGCILDNIHK